MKKLKNILKDIWADESGAAATEYIFLLVIIVAIAAIFRDRIQDAISGKVEDVAGQIGDFSAN